MWEIPPSDVATADAARDAEDWDQGAAGGTGWTSITTAAGEGEAAAWWSGGGDNENVMVADSNPFDGYEWPAWGQQGGEDGGETWGGNGEGGNATMGWELTAQGEQGGGAEGWTQEWDEGSQNYYWYNALTGESRW